MTEPIPAVLWRYVEGLKHRDVERVGATLAEDVAVVTPGQTRDGAAFLALLAAVYRAFPDWHYDHDEPQALGGGRFTVRWRQGGTHTAALVLPGRPPVAATGTVVRIPEQIFTYRIVGDRLVEIRPDPIPGGAPWGILEQVGAGPLDPPAAAQAR